MTVQPSPILDEPDVATGRKVSTAAWLIPTILYVLAVGGLGVTSKLGLDTLKWQQMVPWLGFGYIGTALYCLGTRQAKVETGPGGKWAALSTCLAVSSMLSLYLALEEGKASTVVTIGAAYPAVTVALSVALLAERLSAARLAGMAMVIAGVVVLTLG